MAASIEVKFFNSFVLKKVSNNSNDLIWNGSFGIPQDTTPGTIIGGYPMDSAAEQTEDWSIEEARIRGGFNNTSVDFGAKAYLVEEEPEGYIRFNSLIRQMFFQPQMI